MLNVIFLLIGLILLIDSFVPLGIAFGTLYLIPMLLSLNLSKKRQIYLVTVVSIFAIVVGYFISPLTSEIWKAGVNRGLSTLTILCIAFLSLSNNDKKTEKTMLIQEQLKSLKDMKKTIRVLTRKKK